MNTPSRIITRNWHKKLLSLVFAFVIWFLAVQSVKTTRTIKHVPVRIIDLAPEQTVLGLQSNGFLEKKITLTITGNTSVVESLHSTNLEVVISAAGHNESWIAKIDKYNLFCLDKDTRIQKEIQSVVSDDIFISLTEFVTDEITVHVMSPIGCPPKGYECLDVWPKQLTQKVSGPKEYVQSLKEQGLELTFNLNKVSLEELERNRLIQGNNDEIIFPIPDDWKKVTIPFGKTNKIENLNDRQANFLRLLFLKQELLPLNLHLPVFLFFPVKDAQFINPQAYTIEPIPPIVLNQGLYQINIPLYAKYVSKLFLDVVKNNIAITIVMSPPQSNHALNWAVEFIDEKTLEDTFVQTITAQEHGILHDFNLIDESGIRHRFREYLRKLTLYGENGAPLTLSAEINQNSVIVRTKPKKERKHDKSF